MEFTINKFSGPLDLLLHLIKQTDIDIYDIEIEQIANQYLEYIQKMKNLNLNVASSYLVMAAELIEIKAMMLLPKPEIADDDYEEDPKEKLIQRLIEYQNYKNLTSKFHELELQRQQYYTKKASEIDEYEINQNLPSNIGLDKLIEAFEHFLNRQEKNRPLNTKIMTKEYSITKRSNEIRKLIKEKRKINFFDLFEIKNKSYIVVTFLSILSLAKNHELKIEQENNFENIILSEV